MKKVLAMILAVCILMAMTTTALAADESPERVIDSGWVEIGTSGSNDVELHGSVVPSIISVVMPSYIPFDISKSLDTENKVVSPKISITNHSVFSVNVFVDKTDIDLSQLDGTTWAAQQYVGEKQVAIGLKPGDQQPAELSGAIWLKDGKQNTSISSLTPEQTEELFLVGAIGESVPEDRSFTVVATLVARRA